MQTNPFIVGQKLTIISIGGIAHTVKRQIQITRIQEPEPKLHYVNGPIEGYRVGMYREKGKRKEYYFTIQFGDLVFNGWDAPVLIDSEIPGYSGFQGNACLNLTLDTMKLYQKPQPLDETGREFLREYIEKNNLNPNFSERDKAAIVVPGASVHDDGTLLYPEIATDHAVVNRVKEKLAA